MDKNSKIYVAGHRGLVGSAIVGFTGELYFNVDKPDGTMKKLTDVSKVQGLEWKHKVSLKSGIEMIYNWYKEVH